MSLALQFHFPYGIALRIEPYRTLVTNYDVSAIRGFLDNTACTSYLPSEPSIPHFVALGIGPYEPTLPWGTTRRPCNTSYDIPPISGLLDTVTHILIHALKSSIPFLITLSIGLYEPDIEPPSTSICSNADHDISTIRSLLDEMTFLPPGTFERPVPFLVALGIGLYEPDIPIPPTIVYGANYDISPIRGLLDPVAIITTPASEDPIHSLSPWASVFMSQTSGPPVP